MFGTYSSGATTAHMIKSGAGVNPSGMKLGNGSVNKIREFFCIHRQNEKNVSVNIIKRSPPLLSAYGSYFSPKYEGRELGLGRGVEKDRKEIMSYY